jgi:ion channel-forming bestrophin family protein
MMVSNRGSTLRILVWQWKKVVFFMACGAAAFVTHDGLEARHLRLPAGPAAIIGAALGIFASFRANAAYSRWWEGRQLWGKLVNASRHFASQVGAYVADATLRRRLLMRHVLYVHVLRCQLRDEPAKADGEVRRLSADWALRDEVGEDLFAETSVGHALVDRSFGDLASSVAEPVRLQSLDQTLGVFLDVQGGCERIKRTPMPRGYGFFVERLLVLFGALFPFSIVHETSWGAIPINLAVCLGFTFISETGRVLEDPFNQYWNTLPLSSLSITIERNVRQRLGDTELPETVRVDANGILW